MTEHSLTNLHRIGGEMYAWSDWDPARGPALPHGAALRHLVTELCAPGHAVLVAGPHDDTVVTALLAAGGQVTWLCRSLSDAQRIAEAYPTVTVLCGSLAKLDPTPRFDLVVAADSLDRLDSVEGPQSTPDELTVLTRVLRPAGALVLALDNPLGIHHWVRLAGDRPYRSDAEWYPPAAHASARPASLAQLHDRLAADGLVPTASYALFPTPQAPTVFVGAPLLGDTTSPLRSHLSAALADALTTAYRGTPVLSDPRQLAATALRAGAEATLAAGWLTVARRGAPATPDPSHELVVGQADDDFTYALTVRDGHPELRMLVPPRGRPERAGMRPIAPTPAPVAGRVVEEQLLHLCAQADLARLRAEVVRLVTWIEHQASDGVVTGPAALVTPSALLDDGVTLRLMTPRWEPVAPVPVATVVTRALWWFAVRLLTAGYPHPWSLTASAAELTAILLGMAGRTLDDEALRAAVDLQVAYETADAGLTESDARARRLELLALQPGTPPVDIRGYRELTEALWRQRYQMSHLLAMVEWTDRIIRSRDYWHSKMDWELQFYRKTWAGRFLMLARNAYRLVRRDIRKVWRRLRGS